MRTSVFLLLIATASAEGVSLRRPALSPDIDEKTCSARRPASIFLTEDRQVFFSFIANQVAAGDRLRIEWIAPSNTVAEAADYNDLPAAASLCFMTQLPVSGFAASSQPGAWSVRVLVNGIEIGRSAFEIKGPAGNSGLRIGNVTRRLNGNQAELLIDGAGFDLMSVVHIAEYRRGGGWRYIHSSLPSSATANRLVAPIPLLGPGEYVAIIKNPDDTVSQPARLLVASASGYQLPLAAGERWQITQVPYGSFSHWGNSLHAYDIAPQGGQWVAAMRAGVAHPHDVGAVQSHTLRTFGNYITIDHGDGEYSHYAHLASGTFRVREGERVEAGQVLAHVGNSGYTLGEGGGYHVHVHVTRQAPVWSLSIPFRFTEFEDTPLAALRNRMVVSTATPVVSAAAEKKPAAVRATLARPTMRRAGKVAVAGIWSDVVTVPESARDLELVLAWDRKDQDVDLRVVSPSGRQYGAIGDAAGYSGPLTNPKRFRRPDPEPGTWLVIAAGMRGGGEAIEFTLEAAVTPAGRRGRTGD